ncbi:Mur ligase family protein [Piscinibacter sp.]|uniref:Mur ligase family protein n=1 Tax=Piscinibacter sp. TaxID=1903157 RepID=UPI002C435286|nr:UDP-N-acetylmuramoyl-L-alanyl-D-glutamate--2,6-diaminopimelate ligase [Albitalea sp.]HUG21498.1 UDP-N-acetylmuramoyl-L-alanyl-D-glutamate--2,6-diaminopimelate ligase [Albitalea sp.]
MLRQLRSVADALAWLASRGVVSLTTDSRQVMAGDAFIAWPGQSQDGRQYVAAALAAGAAACIVEADGAKAFGLGDDDRVAAMPGLKAACGPLASGFLGKPSKRLKVIATTGTNGKTSTAWWVAQALTVLGHRSGVIGTLGIGEPPSRDEPGSITSTGLTTPDPVTLHAAFKGFADADFTACAVEASSIGIVEHRLAGTHIAVVLFTNFTQDHLDYHGSMDAYWQAKAQLFAWPGLEAAVLNLDDARGAAMAQQLQGSGDDSPSSDAYIGRSPEGASADVARPVDESRQRAAGLGAARRSARLDLWTYSTRQDARLYAHQIEYVHGGLAFDVYEGQTQAVVRTALIGEYNVSNLLAVIGGLRALGVPLADAADACARLTPVPGRMQRVIAEAEYDDEVHRYEGLPEVVVDYAHTPDALEKALLALQPLAKSRGGELWCVFGCGGNRDTSKRPLMGALAQRLANRTVVTSDNPRHERPSEILAEIVAGMSGTNKPMVIEDRRAAIAQAVRFADGRDVILIAGKGHEDYQEVGGLKVPFSDVVEARQMLAHKTGIRRGRP